jgi:PAS domain S-box-containing protein
MSSSNRPNSIQDTYDALHRISDPIIVLDGDNRLTYMSQEAAQFFDLDPKSLVGEDIWDAFPGPWETKTQNALRRAIERNQETSFERYNRRVEHWFEYKVDSDETGTTVRFSDITERKEREIESNRAETLFQNTQDGLFVVDVEDDGDTFRLNRVNQSYEELTNASIGELQGKTVREITTDAESEAVRERYRECVNKRTELTYEERVSVLGDDAWWETKITPVVADDEVTRLVGATRKITERKQRENQLRKFEQMVQHTGHAVFFTNTDGEIQYVNPAFERMTGYTSAEITGQTPDVLNSGAHADTHFASLWETVLDGNVWNDEIVNERKDGTQFVANHTIAPVKDESGEVTNFVAIYDDITERKERESELRRKTRAIDKAPVGITIADPSLEDEPLTYVNERFTEATGYDEGEAVGRNCRFLQGEKTDPEKVARLRNSVDQTESGEVTLRNYRKDGTEFWNRLSIAPVRDENGDLESFVGFQTDITERKEREKRLQTHELVVQAMNEVAFLVDDQKQIRFANKAALDFADASLTELVGLPMGPITEEMAAPDEDPTRFIQAIDSVLQNEDSTVGKWIRDPDGTETLSLEFDLCLESIGTVCAEQRFVPVELYDGRKGVAVISRDITERKEKEEEIQQHLVQAQEIGNMGSWHLDIEAEDLHWSDECYRIFDIPQGQPMTYGRFLNAVHPEDREVVTDAWDAALEGETYDIEHRILVNDGIRWVHETAEVKFDEDGQPTSGVGVVRDITQQIERERKIIEQKRRYEALFNSIRDPIIVTDTDGRITNCNPGFTDQFGYELDEVEGQSVSTLLAVDNDATQPSMLGHNATGSITERATGEYRKRSGQEFPGETSLSRFTDAEGDVVGFVYQIRDVSEREKNRQQMKVIDRVLRHNIKNDMTAIIGHCELIETKGSGEIQPSAEKILEVSRNFVETAEKQRKITGVLTEPPDRTVFDIVPVVESVVREIQEECPAADVSVTLPESLRVGAIYNIGQALRELLLNAVVHSDKARPTVDVDVRNEDETAAISIRDDGPGIPEMESNILTRQAETDPLYHGSGLGLWLVHEIVRRSDGRLAFEGTDSEGSTVTIYLPTE